MHRLVTLLADGDRRQKGRSESVVAAILKQPVRFGALVEGLRERDPALRMRVADAIEKITRTRPELLVPHKRSFLATFSRIDQKEVRWHLAQILPRLPLSAVERKQVFERLNSWLADDSRIVKAFALQGLADLALQDSRYRPRVLALVKRLMASGIPAVQSRARKLLPVLQDIREKKSRRRSRQIPMPAGTSRKARPVKRGH